MSENNKSKKAYKVVIQAGRTFDLGNGLTVCNGSDDHLKVTSRDGFNVKSPVSYHAINLCYLHKYNVPEPKVFFRLINTRM